MRAAVLREFKEPLSIEDVEQPQPGAHEVLIEVEGCGVCHSDLHVSDGDWPQIVSITKKPLILGHEIADRVPLFHDATRNFVPENKGGRGPRFGSGRPRRRSVDLLDLRGMRLVPRREREPLHETKNSGGNGRRRICGIRQGSRESCD